MATLYSDIYIDGMNTEILAADGSQIKEAWLDGECIWKLIDEYAITQINFITWYKGSYYAAGRVGVMKDGYYYLYPSILIGDAVDNLIAHKQTINTTTSITDYSRGYGVSGISCDENGVWIKRTGYGQNATYAPSMGLHSGYEFADEKQTIFQWFNDNKEFNIPKSTDGTLSIGDAKYYVYSSSLGSASIYNWGSRVETLSGGIWGYMLGLGNRAFFVFQSADNTTWNGKYDWYDCQNTPNPYYRYPLIYLRDIDGWKDMGIVYFPLGELYEKIKNNGASNVILRGFQTTRCVQNNEIVLGVSLIYAGDFNYAIWQYDGENFKYKLFPDSLNSNDFYYLGVIGEKFFRISRDDVGDYTMCIFDSIYDAFDTPKKFPIDEYYVLSGISSAFFKENYLYMTTNNSFPNDTITWLKINMETFKQTVETVNVISR